VRLPCRGRVLPWSPTRCCCGARCSRHMQTGQLLRRRRGDYGYDAPRQGLLPTGGGALAFVCLTAVHQRDRRLLLAASNRSGARSCWCDLRCTCTRHAAENSRCGPRSCLAQRYVATSKCSGPAARCWSPTRRRPVRVAGVGGAPARLRSHGLSCAGLGRIIAEAEFDQVSSVDVPPWLRYAGAVMRSDGMG
jgi:hypothetical protein